MKNLLATLILTSTLAFSSIVLASSSVDPLITQRVNKVFKNSCLKETPAVYLISDGMNLNREIYQETSIWYSVETKTLMSTSSIIDDETNVHLKEKMLTPGKDIIIDGANLIISVSFEIPLSVAKKISHNEATDKITHHVSYKINMKQLSKALKKNSVSEFIDLVLDQELDDIVSVDQMIESKDLENGVEKLTGARVSSNFDFITDLFLKNTISRETLNAFNADSERFDQACTEEASMAANVIFEDDTAFNMIDEYNEKAEHIENAIEVLKALANN